MKQWHETREVLDRLAELAREGKRAALATVVRVRGSAYRHEGAKLLVGEDGSTTGNVSGGCLEQDVREVALQVIRSGKAELRNYCSSADEIEAWDLGVGCEGEVEVFVEPVSEPRPRERELLDRREPFVVATIVGMRDAGCGMRLIMTADDSAGDLESTELNGAVTTQARALLGTEQSGLHEIAGRSVFCSALARTRGRSPASRRTSAFAWSSWTAARATLRTSGSRPRRGWWRATALSW